MRTSTKHQHGQEWNTWHRYADPLMGPFFRHGSVVASEVALHDIELIHEPHTMCARLLLSACANAFVDLAIEKISSMVQKAWL